jgi:hypothetical protein
MFSKSERRDSDNDVANSNSGAINRNRGSVVRLALLGLVVLLVASFAATAFAGAVPASLPLPGAAQYTFELSSNMTSADRNDTIGYSIWLNVTAGTLQLARVNLTLDPDLLLVLRTTTYPTACGIIVTNATFAEWQCSFLRSGRSYRWSVSAAVAANATRAKFRMAVARSVELGVPAPAPQSAQVGVWILSGVLELNVKADPGSAAPQGYNVNFTVNVTNIFPLNLSNPSNERNLTAYNVRISIGISPLLDVGNSTPRFMARANLTPGETVGVTFPAIVSGRAAVGDQVWVNATLEYNDVAGRPIGPKFEEQRIAVLAPPAPAAFSYVLAIAAFALVGVLAAVVVGPILGERSLRIDEVFLVHRNGTLIRHVRRGPGSRKDDDVLASMILAVQDFVRDSFHTGATLDEFSFAGRKAAVLRGEHVVLAALLARGSPRYLFSQMKAVERDIEDAAGAALEGWDGTSSNLDRVEPILQLFLRGGYRGTWS